MIHSWYIQMILTGIWCCSCQLSTPRTKKLPPFLFGVTLELCLRPFVRVLWVLFFRLLVIVDQLLAVVVLLTHVLASAFTTFFLVGEMY